MFTSEFNERSRSNPLCDFRLGTVVTSDHETPLTWEGSGGGGDGGWVGVVFVVPSEVSLKIAGVEQLSQGKRMIGGIGHVLFSTYSQTYKWERSKGFFGEPLKHVISLRGQIFGKQN